MTAGEIWQLLLRLAAPFSMVLVLAIAMGVPMLRGAVKLHRRLTRRSSRSRRVSEPTILRSLLIMLPVVLVNAFLIGGLWISLLREVDRAVVLINSVLMILVSVPLCVLTTTCLLHWLLPASYQTALGVAACLLCVGIPVAGALCVLIPLFHALFRLAIGS